MVRVGGRGGREREKGGWGGEGGMRAKGGDDWVGGDN